MIMCAGTGAFVDARNERLQKVGIKTLLGILFNG